jgi:hypothetical protein
MRTKSFDRYKATVAIVKGVGYIAIQAGWEKKKYSSDRFNV